MAADIFIYGTSIQTGAATDTIQTLALLFIFQDIGPAIIEQYHIHIGGTIRFIALSGAGDDGIVYRYSLPGTKSGKQGPE